MMKDKISKLKALFTRGNIFITIVALLFLIQYIQIGRVFGMFSSFDKKDSSLIEEIGQIKEAYMNMGQDLSEVRKFLRMPSLNYAGFEEPVNAAEEEGKNKDAVQVALFKYVDFLALNKNLEEKTAKNKALFSGLIMSKTFAIFLQQQGLSASEVTEDDSSFSFTLFGPEKESLIFYFFSKEEGKLFFKTLEEKKEVTYKDLADFEIQLTGFIRTNRDNLIKTVRSLNNQKKKIDEAINSPKTREALTKLSIKLDSRFLDRDLKITYSIFNRNDELIGEIVLDTKNLEINLLDKNNKNMLVKVTDIDTALVPFLEKLSTKTLLEKKADSAMAVLKKTFEDDGFKALLKVNNWKMANQPRVDEDRIYYDILGADGKPMSSIVMEKTTGVINIVNPDGTNSQNLLFFDPEFKKKTLEIPKNLPDYGDEVVDGDNDFNILIAGKNGSLVDTMIFAHVNEERGDVRMISIPRDLHYNGRKINAYAHYYGMEELKKILSEITGYQLDKYILIDMYAFIEVIDLIGGIDIHLNSAVIDPSYKTLDNGKEGTLHYEPGDYHLGGKEALRLARTRHTSSDFARAERQQMILKALQDKAKNFGFGDADTIYEIAKTVLNKTETDIGIDEALAYYFRYQNYEIKSNNVMSSGNVLYVPPYITAENCVKLIEEAAAAGQPKPGCENENQAYTLLPRDNNWNVIKWFFRNNFEG